MKEIIKKKFKMFTSRFTAAFTSCMTVMVQGDLPSLTLKHAMVAGRTGLLTGTIAVAMSFGKFDFKYKLPILMFVSTLIADYISHPSHFINDYAEAITTAIGAAMISYYAANTKLGKKMEEDI